MKGAYAFCPESGAPLSEELHYDEFGRSRRHAERDGHAGETQPDGELTNGALRSSRIALFNHFRNCHRRSHDDDEELYSKAAAGLARLKRAASGRTAWDLYVWYALGEWLSRAEFDATWMTAHVEPRCPDCAGELKYERGIDDELLGYCAVDCNETNVERLDEIRDRVAGLYRQTFTDAERLESNELRLL
jgi:hypothetical protein